MERKLADTGITYKSPAEIPAVDKGRKLKKHQVADLLAYDSIVVELKAMDKLTGNDEAQLLNYLKAKNEVRPTDQPRKQGARMEKNGVVIDARSCPFVDRK